MIQVKRSLFFITLPLCTIGCFAFAGTVRAQVTSDGTLPTPTTVSTQGNNFTINGGTQAGGNLFHSFREFSVPNRGSAIFNNAATIQNIISRVTGGSVSDINGLIRANGSANVFLLNPAGIIFGPNARLQIGGSFLASTASSLLFNNGLEEFKVNPQESSLLSINIPTGLRFRDNPEPGSITTQSARLRVNPSQTLALVGGKVQLNGGRWDTPGSRVELAGVAGTGTVGLNIDGSNLRLSFPDGVPRADVSLTNDTNIDVSNRGEGSITINARNIEISGDSVLRAGIKDRLESLQSQAGDIELNATGNINIIDGTNGQTFIANTTFGRGDAGKVRMTAGDRIFFDGSVVYSIVEDKGVGNGGDIDIKAGSLSMTNNAGLVASTYGTGKAGNVVVNAQNGSVSLKGGSNIFSTVQPGGNGNGGDITITAGSLSMTDNANLIASTYGTGKAGNVVVNAQNGSVSLKGGSNILSNVEPGGNGKGGDITITARSLSLENGSQLQTLIGAADTEKNLPAGRGDAGNVNITVDGGDVTLAGAQISSSTYGTGKAGNVVVNAKNGSVSLKGGSYILSNVERGGNGKGGDITITARSLSLENGSQLQTLIGAADTEKNLPAGRGDAGNVNITVDGGDVTLTNGQIFSSTYGTGKAGNVVVNAQNGSVSLKGGSVIFSNVEWGANGNGGDITITAGSLFLDNGAKLYARVLDNAQGNGGNINIKTGSFSAQRASELEVITRGQGTAGNIKIEANEFFLSSNSALIGDVAPGGEGGGSIDLDVKGKILLIGGETAISGESTRITLGVQPEGRGSGGNLTLKAGSLELKNGAIIKASTQGQGKAGDITITADAVEISGSVPTSGLPSGLFTSTNTSFEAGDIIVNAGTFKIADGAALSARTTRDGQGGNITVNAKSFFEATGGGQLVTTTSGKGQAGNIFINATDRATITGSDPNYDRRINRINKKIEALKSSDPYQLSLIANNIQVGPASGLFASSTSTGNAGNINIIETGSLSVTDAAKVAVDSQGQGNGGKISIQADSLTLNRGTLSATTNSANGGDIELNLRNFLRLRNESLISTNAGNNGGNIKINVPFIVSFPSNNDITANATSGNGGKVDINASLFGIAPLSRQQLEKLSPTLNPRELPTSDITAISQNNPNLSGQVNINNPNVDPSQGLVELPETVIDPTQQVAQNPCQRGVGSTFVITGRGGVPSSPNQAISSDNVRVDLVQPVASTGSSNSASTKKPSTTATVKQIVPAQGWIFNEKGEVVLTAYDPTNTGSQRNWQKPASCAVR